MTDLYTVSVDSVAGTDFRGRVHLINPDADFVPTGRTFPASLVFETWFPEDDETPRSTGPGDEDPFVTAQRPEMEAMILGRRKIHVDEDGYLLSDDGRTLLEPRRHRDDVPGEPLGSGRDDISEYFSLEVPDEDLVRHASSIIASYEVGPLRNIPLISEVIRFGSGAEGPLTEEESVLREVEVPPDGMYAEAWDLVSTRPLAERPYADIAFTVTDARYLKHLTPGLRWRTAIWR